MSARTTTGSVWSLPGYRWLWSARAASSWGDAFATVALSLLVFDRTGSGLGVAGVVAAEIIPVLALAPIAGVVVDRVSPPRVMIAFWINAASFAASAVLLTRIRLPHRPAAATRPRWWRQVRAGAALIGHDRLLRALAAGQLLAPLSAGATSALLVVLIREHVGLDAQGYGLALGAIGVGAALGPVLLSRIRDPRRPAFVFGPYLLRAAVDLVLALVRIPAIALAALPDTASARRPAPSPSTHSSRPMHPSTLAAASSRASTCSGNSAASPP